MANIVEASRCLPSTLKLVFKLLSYSCFFNIIVLNYLGMICPTCRQPGGPCEPHPEVLQEFEVILDENCWSRMVSKHY